MNPLIRFIRTPQGKALASQAIEAVAQGVLEALTNAGTAGRVFQQVDPAIEMQRQRAMEQARVAKNINPPRARVRYARDVHIKDADVLDVRVDETYKSGPDTDPDVSAQDYNEP